MPTMRRAPLNSRPTPSCGAKSSASAPLGASLITVRTIAPLSSAPLANALGVPAGQAQKSRARCHLVSPAADLPESHSGSTSARGRGPAVDGDRRRAGRRAGDRDRGALRSARARPGHEPDLVPPAAPERAGVGEVERQQHGRDRVAVARHRGEIAPTAGRTPSPCHPPSATQRGTGRSAAPGLFARPEGASSTHSRRVPSGSALPPRSTASRAPAGLPAASSAAAARATPASVESRFSISPRTRVAAYWPTSA